MTDERPPTRKDMVFTEAMARARFLLETNGAFYPIAYACHAVGAPICIATVADDDQPTVTEYRALLERRLRAYVLTQDPPIDLVAVAVDSLMTDSVTGVKGDAVFVHIEARGEEEATECIVYYRLVDGRLETSPPVAQRGALRFFVD